MTFFQPIRICSMILGMGILLAGTGTSSALPVQVREISITPSSIASVEIPGLYTGDAYVGITQLEIDGQVVNGFCIDPHHFSSADLHPYEFVPLVNEEKGPIGPLGTENARVISNLWALNYSGALTDANQAAALQVAIWLVVTQADNGSLGLPIFHTQVFGAFDAQTLVSNAVAFTGPGANLVALHGEPQDFVVLDVPDQGATTLAMLGLITLSVIWLNRRMTTSGSI